MARIKVTQEIKVYEIGGKEVPLGTDKNLGILSHWNVRDFVILNFGNEMQITVSGNDLITAINNAMNTGGV
jgi:hypothetical protein